MKVYSNGKKAAVIVLHQMFMIMMITCVYAIDYYIRVSSENMLCNFLTFAIIGLIGNFVTLAYLTNITGRKSEEDLTIYYYKIDKIYSDVLLVLFAVLIYGIVHITISLRLSDFTLSSLLLAAGTITYIFDTFFLVIYMSIVRKVKGNSLLEMSLVGKIYFFLKGIWTKKENPKYITRAAKERYKIMRAIEAIASGALDTTLEEDKFSEQHRGLAHAVNQIRNGLSDAVRESTRNERMKADLITNVSHDLKTPLTSIVNYVDLLKRENLDNENAKKYIEIIDEKSQRLKHLTEDLVEASKISSGNVKLDIQKIDWVELIYQTGGEFDERFEDKHLTIVTKLPKKSVFVEADGRQLYRVMENLYSNAAKYALENTRVYVELMEKDDKAIFSIKNISKNPIQLVDGDTSLLTERFVRGEVSRTTEGSGLGLSIAKNLSLLMGAEFELRVEDDLFVATITFKMA